MPGQAAVSLLLFQLEKILKAQPFASSKNMFPSLYTRAVCNFQTVKYGKKIKNINAFRKNNNGIFWK